MVFNSPKVHQRHHNVQQHIDHMIASRVESMKKIVPPECEHTQRSIGFVALLLQIKMNQVIVIWILWGFYVNVKTLWALNENHKYRNMSHISPQIFNNSPFFLINDNSFIEGTRCVKWRLSEVNCKPDGNINGAELATKWHCLYDYFVGYVVMCQCKSLFYGLLMDIRPSAHTFQSS